MHWHALEKPQGSSAPALMHRRVLQAVLPSYAPHCPNLPLAHKPHKHPLTPFSHALTLSKEKLQHTQAFH